MKLRKDWTARALAVIALAFAVGGGTAFAAVHYIITSTKQIKPSVLKKLERRGPQGPRGPQGSQGPQGPQGSQGSQGPKGDTGNAGANGAVAAYYASAGPTSFTNASGKTLVSKTLPAGMYAVSGEVSVFAQKSTALGVALVCYLQGAGVNQQQAFVAAWNADDDNVAQGTLNWSFAGTQASAGAVTISCSDDSGPGGATDTTGVVSLSLSGSITAVQTNSIS